MPPSTSVPPSARSGGAVRWALGAALVIALFAAYAVALRGDFLWDDDLHITANPTIIGPLGLKEIWTTARANYFPLVLTNFWVQHALWGLNPVGYHVVTLACHALAALLLWRVLSQLQVPGAWLGAALWALHPVQVESVAWICELKNTQSAVFFIAALGCWLSWLGIGPASGRAGERGGQSRPAFYVFAFVCFLGAILSKPSTVMLPVVLGLVAWWRGEGLTRRVMWALVPFFALSALASGWTIWEQRIHSGAEGAEWSQTWPERIAIAGHVIWFYLGKLAWPEPLLFIYPRWVIDVARPLVFLPMLAALAVVGGLWWWRDRGLRPVLVAAVFFGALLFPVLGFFNVYFFRYSYVGDHFQYLASIGPLALAGAGLTAAGAMLPAAWRQVRPSAAGGLVAALALLTWRESREYVNNETLWRATLARNPGAFMAWANLGDTLVQQGRHREAIACFRRGLELRPDDAPTHNDLGCELVAVGEINAGIALLERALQLRPGYAEAHNNLGNALRSAGRVDEAIVQYEAALKSKPDHATAHNNLGCELAGQGRFPEALSHLQEAIRLRPNDATSHSNLGNTLRNLGRMPDALAAFARAIELKPDYAEARSNWGLALNAAQRPAEALVQFEAAVKLQPDSAKMRHDWAQALVRSGRTAEALAQFEQVVRLDPEAVAPRATLANTLAQAERWAEAITHYEAALKRAPNDADLQANLGVALGSLGRMPEAVAHFAAALKLRPAFPEAHTNLAQILRSLGRYLEAAEHFDEAERLRAQALRRR